MSLELGPAFGRDFFERPARVLAPRLLGCFLRTPEVTIRITEVEAYEGASDPGSHAFRGKTRRNATMFGPAGHLYVYRHMGLHSCCNIVAESAASNGCLLRAGEVVDGLEVARQRRSSAGVTRRDTDLAQGPGRFTVALGISYLDDGLDLCAPDGPIAIHDRLAEPEIVNGPRIGLRPEATTPEELHLRFWIPDDPHVSGFSGRP